jgi:hypothetical protein
MTKFKTQDAYPKELTPARQELARLLDARDAAGAESGVLLERVARLARAAEAIQPLETELTALGIREAAAALVWVEADDGSDAPVADVAKRAEIESKLTAARAQATAADGATASVSSQITRVNDELTRLGPRIAQSVALVILDEVNAALPEMVAAVAQIEAVKAKVNSARDYVIGTGQRLPNGMGQPLLAGLERFDAAARIAGALKETDHSAANAAWSSFADRLSADASAALEG